MDQPRHATDHESLELGEQMVIYDLNVEGISKAKCEIIAKQAYELNALIITLQETHTNNDADLEKRGNIEGFNLICATHSRVHGIATYALSSIDEYDILTNDIIDGVFLNAVKIQGIVVINIYKPPSISWPENVIFPYENPCLYIGDMNSRHITWGYRSNNPDGELLLDWANNNALELIYDAKDRKSFFSKVHKTETNPDLCFISNNLHNKVKRKVLNDFPHSQHRPTLVHIGIRIHLVQSLQKPRYNFLKANWDGFSIEMDHIIDHIPPSTMNYTRFIKLVHSIAKKHIPRGFRKNYIPGWNKKCDVLYKEFLNNNDQSIADELIKTIDESRREKWIKLTENIDMTHSSRKAWSFIRKVGNAAVCKGKKTKVRANEVATRLLNMTKAPLSQDKLKRIHRQNKRDIKQLPIDSEISRDFEIEEVNCAILEMKTGKSPGYDNIFMEFIKHFGSKTRQWLLKLFNNILNTGQFPKEFKRSKIIAIVKPGKSGKEASDFRPITLLSIPYKLFERMILNRIESKIDELIPLEQAAFRKNRGSVEQVLALTTHIENGFHKGLKTFVCFIDMSAAYDTVWGDKLLSKFMKAIPSRKLTIILKNMLYNRIFKVHLNEDESRCRIINDGLIQGSVLSPILFNLYTNDSLAIISRRFIFADDWAIAIQAKTFEEAQIILENDLKTIENYFIENRLKMNPNKSEVCAFHLNNKEAARELIVYLNGIKIRHNFHPKYLGITLDRSLNYKEHIEKTTLKLRTRVNIIQKLAGSNWGANPEVLRSSTLGLVISVADFGSTIWINSCHIEKIDVQVNSALRVVTGTVRATPIPWLFVLANIAPSNLRRRRTAKTLYDNCNFHEKSLLYEILQERITQRLTSRRPIWEFLGSLENFDLDSEWRVAWQNASVVNEYLIDDPTTRVPGFSLSRIAWVRLNRIRTNQGRCNYCLFKWKIVDSPACDCGATEQTIGHIILFCPLRFFDGDYSELHQLNTTRAVEYLNELDVSL